MLDAWGEQVPNGWVTGDDELGRHTGFRQALRERGERYVLGVPCNTIIRDLEAPLPAYQGRGRRPKAPWHLVSAWRYALAPDGWTRVTVRDGEKGPVEIELVTRRVQDPAGTETDGATRMAGSHASSPSRTRARARENHHRMPVIRMPAMGIATI